MLRMLSIIVTFLTQFIVITVTTFVSRKYFVDLIIFHRFTWLHWWDSSHKHCSTHQSELTTICQDLQTEHHCVEGGKVTKVKKTTKVVVKTPKKTVEASKTTTGHVNSPEDIVIGNKKSKTQTPKSTKKTKTPKSVKVAKTPKSVVKKLGVRTPGLNKSVKKTLWSEIVKKNLGKTPNKGKAAKVVALTKAMKKKPAKATVSKTPAKVAKSSVSSTGHANSPAPIVISKKAKTEEVIVTKKGRKSDAKTKKIVPDKTDYEGVSDLLQTPQATPEIVVSTATPKSGKKSSEKRYPKNLSVTQTHARLGNTPESKRRQSMIVGGRKSLGTPVRGRKSLGATPTATPKNKLLSRIKDHPAPNSEKVKKNYSFRDSPQSFLSQSLNVSESPGNLDVTNFDFDAVSTPTLPVEMLVSPIQQKVNYISIFRRDSDLTNGLVRPSIIKTKIQLTFFVFQHSSINYLYQLTLYVNLLSHLYFNLSRL